MPKAIIKSKSGAIITIEGTKDEITQIISDFERTSFVQAAKTEIQKSVLERREEKKRSRASDLVIELREEGFFDKPKTLGEISHALENKGYLYPTTTLSGLVLGLVKRKQLGRKRENGKWVYGK